MSVTFAVSASSAVVGAASYYFYSNSPLRRWSQNSKLVKYAHEGQESMKAVVFEKYSQDSDVMELKTNIARPKSPSSHPELADYVLVSVIAIGVNPVDWKIRRGDLRILLSNHWPKIVGRDFSGIVKEVGRNVTRFRPGDEVYGAIEDMIGTYCEYICCDQKSMAIKPRNIDHIEAAAVPLAAQSAWQGLFEVAKLKNGDSVLILGGSGGVGHFAVQLAKAKGVTVYATCGTDNIHFVKKLGAYKVIDYKCEDFVQVLDGTKVDVVFDTVGSKADRDKAFQVVKRGGIVVTANPEVTHDPNIFNAVATGGDIVWKNLYNVLNNYVTYAPFVVKEKRQDLLEVFTGLIESGQVKPAIDSVFHMNSVRQAHERSQTGRAKGKIVIEVNGIDQTTLPSSK